MVIEDLSARQRPEAIVVVLNIANDIFELGRTNLERHQVRDG